MPMNVLTNALKQLGVDSCFKKKVVRIFAFYKNKKVKCVNGIIR